MNLLRGLDFNLWNTTTYAAIKANRPYVGPQIEYLQGRGVRFGTVRASAGIEPDWTYHRNMAVLADGGIWTIPYHWYDPRRDWRTNVEVFKRQVGNWSGHRMLDLEDSGLIHASKGIFERSLRPFIVECLIDTIYMNPSYGLAYWNGEVWLEEFPLFIAHYDVAAPRVPPPWMAGDWTVWQYTEKEYGPSFGLTTAQAAPYVLKEGALVA